MKRRSIPPSNQTWCRISRRATRRERRREFYELQDARKSHLETSGGYCHSSLEGCRNNRERDVYPVVHMFVLGIDPGLTRTGYGLVRRAHPPQAVAVGVIRTHPDATTPERLAEIHADLSGIIADHRPDVVAIERVFTNRNLRTAIAVSRASGMALLAAAQAGIPVVEYTPTAVKLAVTGDGSADKRMVGEMVTRRLKLPSIPKPADAADALAVALCHVQSMRLAPSGGRP